MRLVRAVVLLCLLLVPSARAEEGSGQFVITKPLSLPEGAIAGGIPSAVFTLGPAPGVRNLTLTAETAHIEHRQRYRLTVPQEPLRLSIALFPDDHVYDAAVVTMQQTTEREGMPDDAPGWLGVYESPHSSVTITATAPMRATVASKTHLGPDSRVETNPRGNSSKDWYSYDAGGPHALVETSGHVVIEGDFVFKFQGPDVELVHDGGSSKHSTGDRRHENETGTWVEKWMYVTVTKARLEFDAVHVVTAALPAASLEWEGGAILDEATGHMRSGRVGYSTQTGGVLEGTLRATLRPVPARDGAAGVLDVEGDLTHTDLALSSALLPAASPQRPVMVGGGLAITLLALFAMGLVVHVRRTRWRLLEPEDLRGTYPMEGLAQLRFAELAAVHAQDAKARTWLLDALGTNPSLVLHVQDSEALRKIREDPAVRMAIDAATKRFLGSRFGT